MIYLIPFSPTGKSFEAAEQISQAFNEEKTVIDLCGEIEDEIPIGADHICIFSVPCYGGRVPETALKRMKKIRGSETPAILCVTFGNRAFEDALLELADCAEANGFVVTAGCALVTEHNVMHVYGQGRPDEKDRKEISEFSAAVAEKLKKGQNSLLKLPGNRPYKVWPGMKVDIFIDERICEKCGLCALKCPVQAISPDGQVTDGNICIICMRCIHICPKGSRSLSKDFIDGLIQRLEPACKERKENQFYI